MKVLEGLRREWGFVKDVVEQDGVDGGCGIWLATLLLPHARQCYTVKGKQVAVSSFVIHSSLKVLPSSPPLPSYIFTEPE